MDTSAEGIPLSNRGSTLFSAQDIVQLMSGANISPESANAEDVYCDMSDACAVTKNSASPSLFCLPSPSSSSNPFLSSPSSPSPSFPAMVEEPEEVYEVICDITLLNDFKTSESPETDDVYENLQLVYVNAPDKMIAPVDIPEKLEEVYSNSQEVYEVMRDMQEVYEVMRDEADIQEVYENENENEVYEHMRDHNCNVNTISNNPFFLEEPVEVYDTMPNGDTVDEEDFSFKTEFLTDLRSFEVGLVTSQRVPTTAAHDYENTGSKRSRQLSLDGGRRSLNSATACGESIDKTNLKRPIPVPRTRVSLVRVTCVNERVTVS